MRVPNWAGLMTVPLLISFAIVGGCDRQPAPTQADTLRAYQPRFEDMRRKLVQVTSLLPAEKAKGASCRVKAPLTPTFSYRTNFDYATNRTENNAEIMMAGALTDPDAARDFAYGGTELLQSLRWTGPRGPLGDNHFEAGPPPGNYEESNDRQLRARLDYGLTTRYLVVLRVVKYTPPGRDETGFIGGVVLDGFLVDLQQLILLCSFTADASYAALHVINIRPGQSWASRIHEELKESAGYEIAEHLATLTGGVADPPA
ncbi:hypothetical protein [Micromonospora deserti]|uniref:Lipoprotein n=1 Tax=Micromonospora deserti TaxID=2070366 RepID=A0A2W2DSN0_9ACTN|nr:hypothetical protein [Micromonospora deserti]PZG02718.1 hypothetical protein C1I99_01630 [Micromonospora deserti]